MFNSFSIRSGLLVVAVSAALMACDDAGSKNAPAATAGGAAAENTAAKPATQAIIPIAQMKDWCPEHGMPESICVQCNASLAAAFKEKGDWDEQHNLPKSQCFQCDPTLKEKYAVAYKAKYGVAAPTGGEGHHHDKK